jgi:hypothetical protein
MRYILLFVLLSLSAKSQITDITTFPLNDYMIAGNPSNRYPSLNYDKFRDIDTTKFESVIKWGAKGDGKTIDDNAIAAAFKNAVYGVIFPRGRTYISSKTIYVSTSKNLTVWAYDATIKKAPMSRYSFLRVDYPEKGSGNYTGTFIWLGGTLDNDKDHQSWDGSPTGNNEWVESAGQLLMVSKAENFIVKDVTVKNTVINGTLAQRCKIAIVADSKGIDAAQLAYGNVSQQGTYFKVRQTGGTVSGTAFYCFNIDCDKSSIGIHYSTNYIEENSISFLKNCHVLGASQNPLHFEHCRRVFIIDCDIENDIAVAKPKRIQVGNGMLICLIENSIFRNVGLNFNQTANQKLGIVSGCKFTSEYNSASTDFGQFIDGRLTLCINSTFIGRCYNFQSYAKNNKKNTYINFGKLGIKAGVMTDSCIFDTGTRPIEMGSGGVVAKTNTFINVSNPNNTTTPSNNDWRKIFNSSITFLYK